jgi:ribulose bisphosphate carboxylase small subunit
MFARISFDTEQKVSLEEFKNIENTISDKVDSHPLYKDADNKLVTLPSWSYTLDPIEAEEKNKKLVVPTEFVELSTTKEYLTSLELFLQKHPSVKIKVRGMVKTPETDYLNIIDQIQRVQDKLETALKSFNGHVEFNQKCNVHIGNLGLLNVNQVGYAVDKCTEEIQLLLDKGWRILCVCPEPDQRRPDYILGRYNPDEENLQCVSF